ALDTTVAVKRAAVVASAVPASIPAAATAPIATAPARVAPVAAAPAAPVVSARENVLVSQKLNDPWLRAMIVSPNAVDFMNTTLFGMADFRNLGPQLRKPSTSVMMTFSDDPHLGMATERFGGTAVVFVSTVTFNAR